MCLAAVSAGTAIGWSAPVIPQLENATTAPFPVTKSESSWIGAFLPVGALFGAIPGGILADKVGRKLTILSLAGPFLINWGLIVIANSATLMIVGRFFAGLSTGAICVTGSMYIGEFAETEIRGVLGSYFQLFLCVGILISFVLGAFLDYVQLSLTLAVIPIIFVITFKFMPESPVYLMTIGKRTQAEDAIRWFRGKNYNVTPVIEEIQHTIDATAGKESSVADLFKTRGNLRAFISSLGLMLFQQFSGINAVIFYTVTIFELAGSSLNPKVAAILIGSIQVVMAYIAATIIDKAGRKIFLSLSGGIMFICLGGIGFFFQQKESDVDVSNIGWLPLSCLLLYIVGFCLGYGPIPWMIMGELFTPELKGVASGIAVLTNWFLTFVVTKSFDSMVAAFGISGTFFTFMAFVFAGLVFVQVVLPETRGKSLQEIQDELNGRKNIRKSANI